MSSTERYLNQNYIKLISVVLFIFIMSLVSMFSYGVGADDDGYLYHWDNILSLDKYILLGEMPYEIGLEWFYVFMFSFFKIFTNDISVFKFFNTFIALSVLAYAYFKITAKYYFILLLYTVIYLFVDVYIDQYRSGLASAFGLLAIVLFSEGKTKLSLLWLLLGCIIHNSLIWLLIIYI
ncbi:EpsG family protein [Campylobacter sp. RM12920]|uniref:EpsG family protein n=1 Tax=Campylobacter californiensis TaxID=1032243 RepID=A0ABD4JH07_9BACT|nr:EpsG family protein [Campylobacter sp. RM12919]MBE2987456.1 EpsG family protein [Campylobacter sp. RM12920]